MTTAQAILALPDVLAAGPLPMVDLEHELGPPAAAAVVEHLWSGTVVGLMYEGLWCYQAIERPRGDRRRGMRGVARPSP